MTGNFFKKNVSGHFTMENIFFFTLRKIINKKNCYAFVKNCTILLQPVLPGIISVKNDKCVEVQRRKEWHFM